MSLSRIVANFTVKQVRNIPYFVTANNSGLLLNVFINLNYPFANKWQTYNGANPYSNQAVQVRTNFTQNQINFWETPTGN